VIVYVLGAPGAGKSALAPHLRGLLPEHLVIDWDAFMEPAGEPAGRDIRADASTWAAYSRLVYSIVESAGAVDVVLLGGGSRPC
jgi:adenylate kinase family enzyme